MDGLLLTGLLGLRMLLEGHRLLKLLLPLLQVHLKCGFLNEVMFEGW